jgi:hypothetical protein
MSYGFMSHVTAIVKLLAFLTVVYQTTKLCKDITYSTHLLSRQLAQWHVGSWIQHLRVLYAEGETEFNLIAHFFLCYVLKKKQWCCKSSRQGGRQDVFLLREQLSETAVRLL